MLSHGQKQTRKEREKEKKKKNTIQYKTKGKTTSNRIFLFLFFTNTIINTFLFFCPTHNKQTKTQNTNSTPTLLSPTVSHSFRVCLQKNFFHPIYILFLYVNTIKQGKIFSKQCKMNKLTNINTEQVNLVVV